MTSEVRAYLTGCEELKRDLEAHHAAIERLHSGQNRILARLKLLEKTRKQVRLYDFLMVSVVFVLNPAPT
jgi:hypothetical protein